jgi:hypothetical protein
MAVFETADFVSVPLLSCQLPYGYGVIVYVHARSVSALAPEYVHIACLWQLDMLLTA